jgi:hypothetical protein
VGLRSRRKGACGEREVVHYFNDRGIHAERDGRISKSDVALPLHGWRLEVKRIKSCRTLYRWLQQAVDFAGPLRPAVMVRQDGSPWLVVMAAEEYARLLNERQR